LTAMISSQPYIGRLAKLQVAEGSSRQKQRKISSADLSADSHFTRISNANGHS
jgi:hypothetical protein